MKIATFRFFPLLLLACGAPTVQQEAVSPANQAADAAATITAADMRNRIAFLASDALRGRDTPSPGLDTAAAWIAREFERMGLEPGGEAGSYLQRYPFTIRTLTGDATWQGLRYGRDFFVWAGMPSEISGPLVPVTTDLADVPAATIKGKVPVVRVPGRLDRAWRSAVGSARNAALLAGANGLIVVLDSLITEDNVRQAAASFATSRSASPLLSVAFVRSQASFSTGPVQIAIPAQVIEHRPPNVAGILRGSDPALRNTYVVISAHMDHVGVGTPDATGDSIYNGADDDASGTSGVLEVAEALAVLPERPARSVLFLLVSGEEKSLLGSRYFSEHPTVPVQQIVANVNIDMIGRNAP
ncbi:MAG TPA: M28 family peptidase, partial [Longimicrobiales bacterium]